MKHTQRVVGDPALDRFKTQLTQRDDYCDPTGEWSDFDLDLLVVLEEIASEDINPDKSLAAYMADIKDLFARPHSSERSADSYDDEAHAPLCPRWPA